MIGYWVVVLDRERHAFSFAGVAFDDAASACGALVAGVGDVCGRECGPASFELDATTG